MHPITLKRYFGTQSAIARAFGISDAAVSHWFRAGEIPPLRKYQLPEVMANASSDPRQTAGPAVPGDQESSQAAPELTQPTNTR